MRVYAAGKTAPLARPTFREEFPRDPLSWTEALVTVVASVHFSRENAHGGILEATRPSILTRESIAVSSRSPRASFLSLYRVIFLDPCPRDFRPQEEARSKIAKYIITRIKVIINLNVNTRDYIYENISLTEGRIIIPII